MPTNYPLVFRREDYIPGEGFISLIRSTGRILLVEEEEGFWVYGVFPCALAASGKTRSDALLEFKETYTAILRDLARNARGAVEFARELERFFHQDAPSLRDEWDEARRMVRERNLELDSMKTASASDYPPGVEIQSIMHPESEAKPAVEEVFALADAA